MPLSTVCAVFLSAVTAFMQPAAPGQPASEPDAQPGEIKQYAPEDLPSADEIFEKHIEAIGGRDAVFAQTNRRISGTYEGVPFNFKARLTIWADAPDKFHMFIKEPAGESFETGYDGQTAWQRRGSRPVQILEQGQTYSELLRTADFFGEASYEDRYETRETSGVVRYAGREAYVVSVTTTDGIKQQLMFDAEKGLYLGMRSSLVDADGKAREVRMISADYKDVGGVLFPHKIMQLVAGMEQPITYTFLRVRADVEDDEHDYAPPAEATTDAGG